MAALHNFIHVHNPRAKTHFIGDDSDHAPGGFYAGDDSLIPTGTGIYDEEEEENLEATMRRNRIADEMWTQYQEVLYQRSLAGMADEESDEESVEENASDDNNDDFYV